MSKIKSQPLCLKPPTQTSNILNTTKLNPETSTTTSIELDLGTHHFQTRFEIAKPIFVELQTQIR